MKLKSGTIKHLQEYITDRIKSRGFDDETLHERLVLLFEEVAELAKACRKASGMNEDTKRENEFLVGEEIGDVLNMLFAIAAELSIDIEKQYIKKEKKVDKRTYNRKS